MTTYHKKCGQFYNSFVIKNAENFLLCCKAKVRISSIGYVKMNSRPTHVAADLASPR